MDYEAPSPRTLEASQAARWIYLTWLGQRPGMLDPQGWPDPEALEALRGHASGGEGVMLEVCDSLLEGTPFVLTQLHRLGRWHRQVVLDALAALV